MKLIEQHISRAILSIAFLLAFGNGVFASSIQYVENTSQNISVVTEDEPEKPLLVTLSIGKDSQSISTQEHSGASFLATYCSNERVFYTRTSCSFQPNYYLSDQRELIFRHLYPFHFFW